MARVPMLLTAVLSLLVVAGPSVADEVSVTLEGGVTTITIVGEGDPRDDTAVIAGSAARVLAAEARASVDPTRAEGLLSGRDALERAQGANLDRGVDPWRAYLDYDATFGRAVWRVFATTDASVGTAEGSVITFDARSGDVLARDAWSVSVTQER